MRKNLLFRLLFFLILTVGGPFTGSLPVFPETLTILHSNDTHGTYKPQRINVNGYEALVGGMEAASHYLNEIRTSEENVLLLDLGDVMTGTIAAKVKYKGVEGGTMIEFMNRLGYDAWSLGNHEFDRGWVHALELIELAKFPTIMSNLVYRENQAPFPTKPYVVLAVGSLKIGVISVIEENFSLEVHKAKVEDLAVLPMVETLSNYVPVLNERSDLIIAIVHSAFSDGLLVARKVPGIDVVLVASEDGKFEEVNGVLVKSTVGHQKTLGYMKLNVEDGRIVDYEQKLIWLWADAKLHPSPDIQDLIGKLDREIGKDCEQVVGKAVFDLKIKDYPKEAPLVESPLGNWITDVFRWKSGAQIGLHNSGAIRSNLNAGPITVGDLFEVSPFQNNLVVFMLSAEEIKLILEKDIQRGRDRLQVSGLKYEYYSKEAKPFGQRVDSIEIDGVKIVKNGRIILPQKNFSVVTNDYIISQAEGKYFGFGIEKARFLNVTISGALIEWLDKNKSVEYQVEKRIVEIR